jgi:hypothetical protein
MLHWAWWVWLGCGGVWAVARGVSAVVRSRRARNAGTCTLGQKQGREAKE